MRRFLVFGLLMVGAWAVAEEESGSRLVKPSWRRLDLQEEKTPDQFDQFGQDAVVQPIPDTPIEKPQAPAPVAPPKTAEQPAAPAAKPAVKAPPQQAADPKASVAAPKLAAKPSAPAAGKARGPASLPPPAKVCAAKDWDPKKMILIL